MRESLKKLLIIAGLLCVCGLLIFGISRILYQEPERNQKIPDLEVIETEVVVETVSEEIVLHKEAVVTEASETTLSADEPEHDKSNSHQILQEPVSKTEKEKPEQPPELKKEQDRFDSTKIPVYENEQEESAEKAEDSKKEEPAHGDKKDGMIFVDGFGWIVDKGGGGAGSLAEDMYENGNKIGVMD